MLIDCALFAGEERMLELRMRTLAGVVDHFAVVASTITHQGEPADCDEILAAFDRAVAAVPPLRSVSLHWCTPDLAVTTKDGRTWDRPTNERGPAGSIWFQAVERQHRDACVDAARWATDDPNALILSSDVDEIPNPDIVAELRSDLGAAMLNTCAWWTMEMRFVSTLLTLRVPQHWYGTCLSTLADLAPQAMRDARTTVDHDDPACGVITNAGVHMSWLGADADRQRKLDSFSHAELRGTFDPVQARADGLHADGQALCVEEFPGDWWWPAPLVDGSFTIPESWYA